ncbi:unnamed protein product, partial [Rotaria sordida]
MISTQVTNPEPDGPCRRWLVCSPGDPDAQELKLDKIRSDELCDPPVAMSDMLAALATQKPAMNKTDLLAYKAFTQG